MNIPHYHINIYWSDEEDCFVGDIPDLKHCTGQGDTPEEVLDKVLNMQIPPPSTVGLRPPKKLDKVVLRALERDPERRYQSAEEMLIELRKVAIASAKAPAPGSTTPSAARRAAVAERRRMPSIINRVASLLRPRI